MAISISHSIMWECSTRCWKNIVEAVIPAKQHKTDVKRRATTKMATAEPTRTERFFNNTTPQEKASEIKDVKVFDMPCQEISGCLQ